ncbi:MAG: glycosyltransferase family 2 protein [Candidatus Lokiarchaeota archaeon]|nr:glycosyltransferase family 2 protein [Candidatus Lokiarchaeota archaeon]
MKLTSTSQNSNLSNKSIKNKEVNYKFPGLNLGVVIPAYNEELNIGRTLDQIPKNISDNLCVIVVDDGSKDKTYEIASKYDITILKHPKNRGNGAATKTGLEFCREKNFELVIILDADGQHPPKYIDDFITSIMEDSVEFVIGNRFKQYYNMDVNRKLCSKLMTAFYFLFLHKKIADPTNGYRALSSKLIQNIEFESEYSLTQEMLFKILPYYKYKEIPIKLNPRDNGESFIKIKNYLTKIVLLFIKFYVFPKIKRITHKILSEEFRNRVKTYYLKT